MPGRRSAAKVAERHLATNVCERERSVAAAREARVGRRETTAPKVNEFEVRLAKEAATTATMATNLAAHHLVEDVGAHSDELLAAPKSCAPARAGARRATARCSPVERALSHTLHR